MKSGMYLPIHIAIAICISLCLMGYTGPVVASGSNDQPEKLDFNIAEGSLSSALIEFSEQSEMVVVVPSSLTDGKTATATMGVMTPEQAMDSLLSGTGLEYSRDQSGVTIRENVTAEKESATGESAADDQVATLVAAGSQSASSAGQISADSPVSASRAANITVELTGTVVDSRTKAFLKGALVEIVELQRVASTDDLGSFRFPALPPGSYSLRISYLGYREYLVTVELTPDRKTYQQKIELTGGNEQEEIVVYGTRSSRAQSLNQERTAENVSTVVSSDMLGDFEGITIAEALRRVPGVAFEQDELTGDGVNVTIRGLQADFNAVKLNGVELPETSGRGRTANLSNILADSVEKITISKSLLPSQDSAGTGGLIEIETKSPLDRPRRFAQFSAERAESGGDFFKENYFTGTVSGLFGDDESFGISLALQYRDSETETIDLTSTYDWGKFLPLGPNGNPSISNRDWLSPATQFPFDPAADQVYQNRIIMASNSVNVENFSATLSLEKQIGDHTNLRFDYLTARREDSSFQASGNFNGRTNYSLRPVQQLGGEMRQAIRLSGSHLADHSYRSVLGGETNTDVYTFNGDSTFGKWELDYTLAYTEGKLDGGQLLNMSFWNLFSSFANPLTTLLSPEAIDPVEGFFLSAFPSPATGAIGAPLFSEAGWNYINNPASYGFTQVALSNNQGGESDRKYGSFSARYDLNMGALSYIESGLSHEGTRFESVGDTDRTSYMASNFLATIDGAGITQFDVRDYASRVGLDRSMYLMSQAAVLAFFNRLPGLSEGPGAFFLPPTVTNLTADLPRTFTEEDELAGFIQARLDIGKLEIIGGVRISQLDLTAAQLFAPIFVDENGIEDVEFSEQFTQVARDQATDTQWLPRVLANYRFNENMIARAGYFKSVARPSISQLSSGTQIILSLAPFYGPTGSQPGMFITAGNPNLEPSFTDNFDLSFEYYTEDIGVVKLGLFYKNVENLFESNAFVTSESSQAMELLEDVNLPDDPRFDPANLPADLYVSKTVPQNSEFDGNIWGVEVAIEKQLSSLPGFWGGFGFFANYTYTESEKDVNLPWFSKPVFDSEGNVIDFESANVLVQGVPFERQPKRSGTIALTYNKYWLDATLSYSYQSKRGDGTGEALAPFIDEVDSVDFRAAYLIDRASTQFKIYVEGADLLRSSDETSSNSVIGPGGRYLARSTYFGGRTFRVGLSVTF